MLPGRTDNAVKNRFHATERARNRNIEKGLMSTDGSYSTYYGGSGNGSVSMDTADMSDSGIDEATLQQLKAAAAASQHAHMDVPSSVAASHHYSPMDKDRSGAFVPIIDSFPSPRFPELEATAMMQKNSSGVAARLSGKRPVSSLDLPTEMTSSTDSYHDTAEHDGEIHDIDFSFLMSDPNNAGGRAFNPSPDSVPEIEDIDWNAHESSMQVDDASATNKRVAYAPPPVSRQSSGIGCGVNLPSQMSMMQNMCGFNVPSRQSMSRQNSSGSRMSTDSSKGPNRQLPPKSPQSIMFQPSPSGPPLNLQPVPGHPNLYYNPSAGFPMQQQQQKPQLHA